MINSHLSLSHFNELLASHDPLAQDEWPLADLVPTQSYITTIEKQRTSRQRRFRNGLAVGRVLSCLDSVVSFGLRTDWDDNEIQLFFEEYDLIKPWRELVGVAMALQVDCIAPTARTPVFRVHKIAAVEPPLHSVSICGAESLSDRYGMGYVHGTMLSAEHALDDAQPVSLYTGYNYPIVLGCGDNPTVLNPEGDICRALYSGDRIRALIAEPGTSIGSYAVSGALYRLDNLPE